MDTLAFQGALGTNISNCIFIISMTISALAIAFTKGWLLALALFAVIPCLSFSTFLYMAVVINK